MKHPKVLITDDSSLIRTMLRDFIEEQGFKAIEAQTADECIQKFKEENPDLLILDIRLPGKNGLEALAEIRKENSQVPAIICTSIVGQEDIINKAIEFGASEYITKPFKKDDAVRAILKHTGHETE